MTSGAPPTTTPVWRLFVSVFVTCVLVAVGVPGLLGRVLDLTPAQLRYVHVSFALGVTAVTFFAALLLGFGLRGVAGAARDDEGARRRVLRLPIRLAGMVAVCGGAITIFSMMFRLLTSNDPASLIFGLGLSTVALIGFLAVPTYIGARAALLPHALFFARETLPSGRRLPIGLLAGYTVVSVAAISIVPAALLGNTRLGVARERAAQVRAQATARRLARIVSDRPPAEATHLIAHTRLDEAVALLRTPSGQLLPEDTAVLAAGAAGEEAPLSGDLRGGAVRVVPLPARTSQAPLLLVVVGLCGIAAAVAISLARALTRDARGVTRQVEALADGRQPPPVPTVTTSEVRRVALAVNRLLERIPRLQLEKFLAVERADESRRLKSMFLANMSHDLRSPLNSILGFSELLTRGLEGPITPGQHAILTEIHVTGNQLLRLLSEILDTARAESGHLDLDRKPTAPATFVTQARKEALRGRPETVGDQLTLDLQAGVGSVHVDSLRIQQALTHILDWAIDAAQGESVRVEIGDRDRPKGRAFVIEVICERDTTSAEEAVLFQPFRKIAGIPGLHLALPLARRLVEAHGGTLEPLSAGEDLPSDRPPRLGVRVVLPRMESGRYPIAR